MGKKINDLSGELIIDPSSGKHFSFPFVPATPSSRSWMLEGVFLDVEAPLKSPQFCLVHCLQNYRLSGMGC